MHTLMDGKKGVVLGVANKRSIAWGITKALHDAGAQIALTYQGERLEQNVRKMAEELDRPLILPCDVSRDEEIEQLFASLKSQFGTLDFLVHSVAFSPKEGLEGEFLNTTREAFQVSQDISAYSLVGLLKGARPLLTEESSVLAMTYYGSEKVVPGYNTMGVAKASLEAVVRYLANDLGPEGVRVNAISAGPVNTVAARGVAGFTGMLKHHQEKAPLRRNVTAEDVGSAALFLLSSMSAAITGEVLFVDGGYNVMGM